MKRKIPGLIAALMLAALALPFAAAPAFAAACADSASENYTDGYTSPTGRGVTGVYGQIAIPGSADFKPCTPNDGDGQNAVVGQIGVRNGSGAWARAGAYRCYNDTAPGQICDGSLRAFAEVHGSTYLGGYAFDDLGTLSYNTTYTFKILAVDGRDDWHFYINNVDKVTWSIGGLVSGSSDEVTQYFAELHDHGDQIGTSPSGTLDIGSLKYRDDGATWHNDPPTTCNFTGNAYINCVKNGSFALYFYRPGT